MAPRNPPSSAFVETVLGEPFHPAQRFAGPELQREMIALRLASPMRPAQDRGAAPVDGLGLFDAVRSPRML